MDELNQNSRSRADWFFFLAMVFFLGPLLLPWSEPFWWVLHILAFGTAGLFWHESLYIWKQIKLEDDRIHREALNDIETNTEEVRISNNLKQFSLEQIALFEKNAPGIEVMFGLPAPTLVLRVHQGQVIPYSFIDQHLRRGNRHYTFAWSNYTMKQDQDWGKLLGDFMCLWGLADDASGSHSFKWLDYETAIQGIYAGGRIRMLEDEVYQVVEPYGSSPGSPQEQENIYA